MVCVVEQMDALGKKLETGGSTCVNVRGDFKQVEWMWMFVRCLDVDGRVDRGIACGCEWMVLRGSGGYGCEWIVCKVPGVLGVVVQAAPAPPVPPPSPLATAPRDR